MTGNIVDFEEQAPHVKTRAVHETAEPPGDDMRDRVAKLEGQLSAQQWAFGVVSAVMVAAIGIVVALQLHVSSSIGDLEGKVDALPKEVSRELQAITTTLSNAITATNSGRQNVIVVPAPPTQPKQE